MPKPQYCEHGNDVNQDCSACEQNLSPLHVIKGTVPVYVYVRDGAVERVVADDTDVTFDLAVHKADPETQEVLEEEKDQVWIQITKDAAFNPQGSKKPWPGWEWGW